MKQNGRFPQEGLKNSSAEVVPINTTLLTAIGTIGDARLAGRSLAINQNFAALVARDGIDSFFLFYLSQHVRPALERLAAGTSYRAIYPREIKRIQVKTPELDEQRRIGSFLLFVDEAIGKAKAELEATRRLKKALMQQLFMRGMPGQHKEFHHSKWVSCPGDWQVYRLKEIADVTAGFTMGRDLSRAQTVTVPYVTVSNVLDGRFDLSSLSTVEIKRQELETGLLEPGDILMTEGGDRDKLGRGGCWRGEIANCAFQNHIFRVRLNRNKYLPDLFHYLIQTYQAKRYFFSHAKQTSNLCTINSRELKWFPVPCPELDEQKNMLEALQAADAAAKQSEESINALIRLKKSLLQNLLTGKVRIKPDTLEAASANLAGETS